MPCTLDAFVMITSYSATVRLAQIWQLHHSHLPQISNWMQCLEFEINSLAFICYSLFYCTLWHSSHVKPWVWPVMCRLKFDIRTFFWCVGQVLTWPWFSPCETSICSLKSFLCTKPLTHLVHLKALVCKTSTACLNTVSSTRYKIFYLSFHVYNYVIV